MFLMQSTVSQACEQLVERRQHRPQHALELQQFHAREGSQTFSFQPQSVRSARASPATVSATSETLTATKHHRTFCVTCQSALEPQHLHNTQ